MPLVQSNSGANNGVTNLVPTLPGATTAGNAIILMVSSAGTLSTPSGFISRNPQVNIQGCYFFEKLSASGNSTDTPTMVQGGTFNGSWFIAEYSGITSFKTSNGSNSTGVANGSMGATPSLTPAAGDTLIFAYFGISASTIASYTAGDPTSWTNSFTGQASLQLAGVSGSGRDGMANGWATRQVTANGSTSYSTAASATVSTSTSNPHRIIVAYAHSASSVTISPWPEYDDFARKKRAAPHLYVYDTDNFTALAPQVWFPQPHWPDRINAARRPVNFDMDVVAIPPTQVWYPPNNWPDWIAKKKQPVDTQPEGFVYPIAPAVVVTSPWPEFDDFARGRGRPLNYNPLAFVPLADTPWNDWSNWPDFAPGKRGINLKDLPWEFLPPPLQVWYPTAPWPDRIDKKKPPVDTQPLAFLQVVLPQATFMIATPWPDFAPGKKRSSQFDATTIGVPPPAPNTGYTQWPDYIRVKRRPLNYDPLAFVQTARTPWVTMTQWPDFAPIKGKAGLQAALQQFLSRSPNTIAQAAVTGVMAAFEINDDTAEFAIYVFPQAPGGPAVQALVSTREINVISSSASVGEV